MSPISEDIYHERLFTAGYPNLEQLGVEWYSQNQGSGQSKIESVISCVSKLIDLRSAHEATVCEIGCGPNPKTLAYLRKMGFRVVGVEPIIAYVHSGRAFLGDPGAVVPGNGEHIPLPDRSQQILILQSVLEHVESPRRTLEEAYRVLSPGGVAYVDTTNRFRLSIRGENGEFRVPFYNWFPPIVKESFVFHHLHYDPALAYFTPRPAIHWFSYSNLCMLGRDAGFAQFYSLLDLVGHGDPLIQGGRLRRYLLDPVRRHPWLRSIALLQFGGSIFMWKRN